MHSTADLYPDAQSVALKRIMKEVAEEAAAKVAGQCNVCLRPYSACSCRGPSLAAYYQRPYLNPGRAPKGG